MMNYSRFFNRLMDLLPHLLWGAVALLSLGSFVVSLAPGYAFYSEICLGAPCYSRLSPLGLPALQALGLTPGFYAAFQLGVAASFTLAYFLMGLLLYLRRPGDRLARFTSMTLIVFGAFAHEWPEILLGEGPFWAGVYDIGSSVAWVLFPIFFYLFPDGRFTPRWTALAAAAWTWMQLGYYVAPQSVLAPTSWPFEYQALLLISLFGTCVYSVIYRYRRVSTPTQRQQTKWVAFAMLLSVAAILAATVPEAVWPGTEVPGTLAYFLVDLFTAVALLLIPLLITMSILRYRLWDIDLMIRRTLIYSLLTAILGLGYFLNVIGLQFLVRSLTGQQSPVAIVISTLSLAVLFNPLRSALQGWIDRSFYRRRYDAIQTITSFSATLREDVDLGDLSTRLVAVVEETIQPAHVSLWISKPRPAQDR